MFLGSNIILNLGFHWKVYEMHTICRHIVDKYYIDILWINSLTSSFAFKHWLIVQETNDSKNSTGAVAM